MSQCLNEIIRGLTDGALCLQGARIVVPLTTGLSVEGPMDVIGIAHRTVHDPTVHTITLPGRDWTGSAQYTGLTEETYEAALGSVDDIRAAVLGDEPLISFASTITRGAFIALGILRSVLPLPKFVQLYYVGAGVLPKRLDGDEPLLPKDVLSAIVDLPTPRMMSRVSYARELGIDLESLRSQSPATEVSINIDAALLQKTLFQ